MSSQESDMTEEDVRTNINQVRQIAREFIDSIMDSNDLDVIAGSKFLRGTIPYPEAGYPTLTLPNGYDENGQPIPLMLFGSYLGEPQLIQVGYAIEQASSVRVAPDLDAAIADIEKLND